MRINDVTKEENLEKKIFYSKAQHLKGTQRRRNWKGDYKVHLTKTNKLTNKAYHTTDSNSLPASNYIFACLSAKPLGLLVCIYSLFGIPLLIFHLEHFPPGFLQANPPLQLSSQEKLSYFWDLLANSQLILFDPSVAWTLDLQQWKKSLWISVCEDNRSNSTNRSGMCWEKQDLVLTESAVSLPPLIIWLDWLPVHHCYFSGLLLGSCPQAPWRPWHQPLSCSSALLQPQTSLLVFRTQFLEKQFLQSPI